MGAKLSLEQFFHKHVIVKDRKGKLRIDSETNSVSYSFDCIEAQTVWQVCGFHPLLQHHPEVNS